jgi:hypothetical protein
MRTVSEPRSTKCDELMKELAPLMEIMSPEADEKHILTKYFPPIS